MTWGNHNREIPLPDWLKHRPVELVPPQASKDLQIAQYDVVFPRVLENVCKGDSLAKAVRELPIPNLDSGAFFRWIKKDPKRYELYKEAKEVQAEVYAGRLVDIAEGIGADGEPSALLEDVTRSRLNFDIYKWLMERNSRKAYGDVKQVEITQNISVRAALDEARSRAFPLIDVEAEEMTDAAPFQPLLSAAPDDSEDDDVQA